MEKESILGGDKNWGYLIQRIKKRGTYVTKMIEKEKW
jgi:hypothetical protein